MPCNNCHLDYCGGSCYEVYGDADECRLRAEGERDRELCEERDMVPDGDLPENFDEDFPYDGEPADIDTDVGYDPYSGGPDLEWLEPPDSDFGCYDDY